MTWETLESLSFCCCFASNFLLQIRPFGKEDVEDFVIHGPRDDMEED